MSSSSSAHDPCNHVGQVSSGFGAASQVRWGSNGASAANPELAVGSSTWHGSGSQCTSGSVQWGQSGSGGTDSGWVAVNLSSGSAGTELTVGTDTLSHAAAPTGIAKVQLKAAAAKTGCKMSFTGFSVSFCRNGVVVDAKVVNPDCNPVVDGAGQLIIEVNTLQPGIDEVRVTGAVRLQLAPGITASGDDLTGEIYVFPGQ
jgi:hypothetical protein